MVDVEYIKQYMRANNIKYWDLLAAQGEHLLFTQQEDVSIEQSIADLDNCLTHIQGKVILKISSRAKKDKSAGGDLKNTTMRYTISVNELPTKQNWQQPATPIAGAGGMNMGLEQILSLAERLASSKIEAVTAQLSLQHQLDSLEAKLKEKNTQSPIMGLVEKNFPRILDLFLSKQPQVVPVKIQGANDSTVNDSYIRIQNALLKLSKIDEDYVSTLEMISEYAQQFPNDFLALKPQLQAYLNPQPNTSQNHDSNTIQQ